MIYKRNTRKTLEVFFEAPRKRFQMRQISRKIKLAPKSTLNHLRVLVKAKMVKKVKSEPYDYYIANFDSEKFRLQRKLHNLSLLHSSGLVDHLWDELQPKALVLFGSFSRGENTKDSDIDIFVNGAETQVDLSKFKKLGKINLFFEKNFPSLSKELKNNIINGVVLKGRLEAFT